MALGHSAWQTQSCGCTRTGGACIRVLRNSSLDSTWRTSGPGRNLESCTSAPQFICPGPPLLSFTGVKHLTVVCKLMVDTRTL
ncbi:hypothetical protein Nmel_010860 [Mimus melanotis]